MPLSFSKLQSYKTCPRLYEFSSIKKLPRRISAGESFGSSVHNTLKKFGELEMGGRESGVGGREEQMEMFGESLQSDAPSLDILIEFWHDSFITQGYETRIDVDLARKRGEELMRKFFSWWESETRGVFAVEKGFRVDVGGRGLEVGGRDNLVITGRFDRLEKVDGGLRVIDFKTSAVRSQEELDADLQLSIYALAVQEVLKEECVELILLFIREDEGIVEMKTTRNKSQLCDAVKQIGMIAERIENKDFNATPSVSVCKRCPYKNVCDVAAA